MSGAATRPAEAGRDWPWCDASRRARRAQGNKRRAGSACRCRPASCASTRRIRRAVSSFAGEDRIEHTPKDETLDLKIGNAFDIVAERTQTDFQKTASNVYESEYEIALRNHKALPVRVGVNEPVGGTWRIVGSSHEWTKSAAFAAQFTVPVGADRTVVLKYRVRVTY